MRIIKRGTLPEAIEYEHTCWRCGTVFAATTKDVTNSPKNESYVKCPVCKAYVDWSNKKPIPVKSEDGLENVYEEIREQIWI